MSKSKKNLSPREKAQLAAAGGSKNKSSLIKKIVIILLFVLVIAGAVFAVISMQKKAAPDFSAVNTPSVATGYGVMVGKDRNIVKEVPAGVSKVTVFQDYMCPGCKAFESTFAADIDKIVDEGIGVIDYNTIAILDQASAGTNYSSRSANVALCAAVAKPDKFYELNKLFYSNQPAEMTGGLKNAELKTIASSLGIEGIDACVSDGEYRGFVKSVTDNAIGKEKVEGTPTVHINGSKVEIGESLYDMVVEANKKLATDAKK